MQNKQKHTQTVHLTTTSNKTTHTRTHDIYLTWNFIFDVFQDQSFLFRHKCESDGVEVTKVRERVAQSIRRTFLANRVAQRAQIRQLAQVWNGQFWHNVVAHQSNWILTNPFTSLACRLGLVQQQLLYGHCTGHPALTGCSIVQQIVIEILVEILIEIGRCGSIVQKIVIEINIH